MATLSSQFLEADVLFSHGFFDIAEEAYAQILKHALEMDDKLLEVAALKAIGDIYLEKSRVSKDGKDFTKASALYNAALVRCADWEGRQSLVHRIKRTEKCFMRHVAGIRKPVASTRKEDINRKLKLEKTRNRCKGQLQTLSSQAYSSYEANPMESEEARNAEGRRTEAVRSLYRYVAVNMKQFIVDMLEECIRTLGTVPCQYAMIGMGSMCREEMTPYSDLEFAILVEEGKCTDQNKNYFRTLTHLLHLKVLNLGETILPAMAIKSLNDFNNKERDWYYDNTTPCGFSFDGSMPWASKTALGRDPTSSKHALELIMTPNEMAELQQDEQSVKEGYHLADVLCNVTLISGEQALVEAYRRKVQELLDLPSQVRLGLTVRAERALESLAGFPIARESILKHFAMFGRPVNVKKVLYRLGSLIVESLGVLFNCIGESVAGTLRNLMKINALTPEAHHNLSTLVAIVDELRLHTYVANRAQRGLLGFSFTMGDYSAYNTRHCKHHVIWHRLLYTLIPLHVCLNKFLTAVDKAVHASVIKSLQGKVDMIGLLNHLTDISRSAFNKDTYRADPMTAGLVLMLLGDPAHSYRLQGQGDALHFVNSAATKFVEYSFNMKKMKVVDVYGIQDDFMTTSLPGVLNAMGHQFLNSPETLGLGVHVLTPMYCFCANAFYCKRDLQLAREMLDLAINEDKNHTYSNFLPEHMYQKLRPPRKLSAVLISRLSAALGDHTTAVKYLEEDLRIEWRNKRDYKRENEMTTRFLLWQSYTELSMPEEAENHRLGWINCLHPHLSETVLMLQGRTSLEAVQSKTVEDRLQMFGESLQADKSVVPWDVATYVLNYSALLEKQKRYVDVYGLFDTALNKLAQRKGPKDFDTKLYPRMIASQAACLFYLRHGNRGRSLECLESVLRYSTLLSLDREACACKDHATVNYVHFITAALHFEQSIEYNVHVKNILLANIDEVCSIVLFRATMFGPKVAEACVDCVYDLGKTLQTIGETLAAVEMFHVGLKICTSHKLFVKSLVFLASMFRARRML